MKTLLRENFWLMEETSLIPFLNSDLTLDAEANAFSGKKRPFKLEGNVAIIKVAGSLNMNFHWPPYCSSYTVIKEQIKAAIADYSVRSILLEIDSPGGTVSGCDDLATAVADADKKKPVYAYSSSQATSAAYWVGSGARYFAAGKTADLGSIGVIMVHMDYTGLYNDAGIKPTIFRAGEFKALGIHLESLSDKAKTSLQSHLDQTCEIFINSIACNRKKLKISNKNEWAEGRVFLGEEAKTIGLIDCVCTRDQLTSHILKEASMDANELRATYPDVVKAIEDNATAEATSQLAGAKTETIKLASDAAIAMFGDTAGGKLKAALEAGLNTEQITTLGLAYDVNVQPEAKVDDSKQAEMLAALLKTDQPGIVPGSKKSNPSAQSFSARMKAKHQGGLANV
ncbi:signal peptide peptidase SppA [Maridesulfovibrio ferrireducens]|uniref:signal peptide peptidase SppA n=1 Tax=Maridesulfovibrio ferrireducens TaxID=246191 RepID=UPI001A1AA212|nr:signal peptide peptidase SppA [Maridesulfovibrio ferrireducens]MBI9112259.1 signal peptide peptidase SppA [Maridesulfovibrio ferrireducens]